MEYLHIDETKIIQPQGGHFRNFLNWINKGLFILYKTQLAKAIKISNIIQGSINQRDYLKYFEILELEKLLEGYKEIIANDTDKNGKKYYYEDEVPGLIELVDYTAQNCPSRIIIQKLKSKLRYFKKQIPKLINSDQGDNLGKLSLAFNDLEACMEHCNFYDFFFISEKIEEEIENLGKLPFKDKKYIENIGFTYYGLQVFDVDEAKRNMVKKLNLYRNLVVKHHPESMTMWEKIKTNRSLVESQKDMALSTQVQAAASATNTVISATASAKIAEELKNIKNLQIATVGISAYEAYQNRKERKKKKKK